MGRTDTKYLLQGGNWEPEQEKKLKLIQPDEQTPSKQAFLNHVTAPALAYFCFCANSYDNADAVHLARIISNYQGTEVEQIIAANFLSTFSRLRKVQQNQAEIKKVLKNPRGKDMLKKNKPTRDKESELEMTYFKVSTKKRRQITKKRIRTRNGRPQNIIEKEKERKRDKVRLTLQSCHQTRRDNVRLRKVHMQKTRMLPLGNPRRIGVENNQTKAITIELFEMRREK